MLFGDETSLGLALALQQHTDGPPILCPVFEVTSLRQFTPILDTLGLDADVMLRRPDDGHLHAATRVIESFIDDSAHFILSGKAQSIQFIGRALKQLGITPRRLRTKAFWAPGKKGLD